MLPPNSNRLLFGSVNVIAISSSGYSKLKCPCFILNALCEYFKDLLLLIL